MENYKNKNLSASERAADLVKRMTVKEKIGQLNQNLYGFNSYKWENFEFVIDDSFKNEVKKWEGLGIVYGVFRADPWSKRNFETGIHGDNVKKAYNKLQKYVIEHSRFQIPAIFATETPHGHQGLDGYLTPVNTAMASTWNPDLIYDAFKVIGKQTKEMGVTLNLISVMDMLRDPRWGRSEECYGEDPHLCSKYAYAALKGSIDGGTEVCAKHYCGQGETTGGINGSACNVGVRDFRDIHLPGAKAAVKAGAKCVMATYNDVDGELCVGNDWLVNDVLRGELGYEGFVMADGCAVDRLSMICGGSKNAEYGAYTVKSGVDMGLWDPGFPALVEAYDKGLITDEEIDLAAYRVLKFKFETGLFDNPYLDESVPLTDFNNGDYPQSKELSKQSVILLKNKEGILPFNNGNSAKIAVIGPNANDIYNQLGDYTPPVRDGYGSTLLKGLTDTYGANNVSFAQGCAVCGDDAAGISEAVKLAKNSDVVVLALGGSSNRFGGAVYDSNGAAFVTGGVQMDCGEGYDSANLKLPGCQHKLAEEIFALDKPVIAVIIAGRPYAIPEITEKANAVLWAFYPGPHGGEAIAEIMCGKVNPSGCLTVTIPRSAGQLPVYYNNRKSYRKFYYSDEDHKALYDFGFGLHYTEFEVSDVEYASETTVDALNGGAELTLKCKVKNIGEMAGYATLQLFNCAEYGSVVRRSKELVSFKKVYLKVGEEKECVLTFGKDELSFCGSDFVTKVEPCAASLRLEEGGKPKWDGWFVIK